MTWQQSDKGLERTIEFADFNQAFDFMVRVANEAEEMNHHPDMCISWNKVTLTLFSHEANAVTEEDLELSRRIDKVVTG